MIGQVRRWLPNRKLIVTADSTYAALDFLAFCQGLRKPVTIITRLRLDAALYDPAPARLAGQNGRPRKKGARQATLAARLSDPATVWTEATVAWYGRTLKTVRLSSGTAVWYHSGMTPVCIRWVLVTDPAGTFEPQALLCTNTSVSAEQMVEWFVLRWQLEVTFEEARAHLGIETQRQWSELAILRTTPGLLGLFSLVTLFAHELRPGQELPVRQAAWYLKDVPTFADTIAFVRQQLWPAEGFWMSCEQGDMVKIPRALLERFTDALAYAT
jgi:hypothetical protein